jgi:hypothetical protein
MHNWHMQYMVMWDNASKHFPYRVLTIDGECLAYFRTSKDAKSFLTNYAR